MMDNRDLVNVVYNDILCYRIESDKCPYQFDGVCTFKKGCVYEDYRKSARDQLNMELIMKDIEEKKKNQKIQIVKPTIII